jgi:hypothetical protein
MIDFIPDDNEIYGCNCAGMSGKIRSKMGALKQRFKKRITNAAKRVKHPRTKAAEKHVNHPRTKRGLLSIVKSAQKMGVDFNDPEIMGNWLQDIGKKFKTAINKTKSVQLTTDRGTAQLGPGGITWTDQQQQQAENAPGEVVQASASGLSDMLKNPMILGAGISLAALLLSKRKGRKK